MENTQSSPPTKVFIVDDSASMRERIAELIHDIKDTVIVGEAESPAKASAGILDTHPDLVVLDIHLSGGSGLDVLRKVHPTSPETIFVVITNHPNPQYRRAYLNAGASYFLDKSSEISSISQIVADFGASHH